jgi:hypothetical protein
VAVMLWCWGTSRRENTIHVVARAQSTGGTHNGEWFTFILSSASIIVEAWWILAYRSVGCGEEAAYLSMYRIQEPVTQGQRRGNVVTIRGVV